MKKPKWRGRGPWLRTDTKVLMLLAIVLFAFAYTCAGKLPPLTSQQKERYELETAYLRSKTLADSKLVSLDKWAFAVIKIVFALGVMVLAFAFAYQGITGVTRKLNEIRPDEAGHYPVVKIYSGGFLRHLLGSGATGYVDLNRRLASTSIFDTVRDEDGHSTIRVTEVNTADDPNVQERMTARHQTMQLTQAHAHSLGRLAEANITPQLPGPYEPENGDVNPAALPGDVQLLQLLEGTKPSLQQLVLGVSTNSSGSPEILRVDMKELVHVAVGGSSGWGKSVFLRSLAYQFILAEENPQLAMIDLQRITLTRFSGYSGLIAPVATDEHSAIQVMVQLRKELERRVKLLDAMDVDDITMYNQKDPDIPLRPLILLADECTALLSTGEVEAHLTALALRGRAPGLWLILAGQNWTHRTLPSAIKDQLSTRVQFKALSKSQSRVLIEDSRAEQLEIRGRAIASLPGRGLIEMQAPHISSQKAATAVTTSPELYQDIIDVTPKVTIMDDTERAVVEAYKELGSTSGAAREVFGHAGGTCFYKARAILEKHNYIG
jgi:hypothetical protein